MEQIGSALEAVLADVRKKMDERKAKADREKVIRLSRSGNSKKRLTKNTKNNARQFSLL